MRVSATARSKRAGSLTGPARARSPPRREEEREREQHEIDRDQRRGDLVGEELGGGAPRLERMRA